MAEKTNSAEEGEGFLRSAKRLLESHDLIGARELALRAKEAEPLLEASDRILAVVNVLLAAGGRDQDSYAILQIDRNQSVFADCDLIKRQYRRLALLLHPDKNKLPLANQAFRLVTEARSALLSGTQNRLTPTVSSRTVDAATRRREQVETFWTVCPYCYYMFEYPTIYEDCCLRCHNCRRAMQAVRVSQPPQIVPGRDEYICTRHFFPVDSASGNDRRSHNFGTPK